MKYVFILLILTLAACNTETHESNIPTGKGKVHGELNKRETPCRLRTVEKSTDLENHWVCVYDHPKSEIDDDFSLSISTGFSLLPLRVTHFQYQSLSLFNFYLGSGDNIDFHELNNKISYIDMSQGDLSSSGDLKRIPPKDL